MNLNNLDMKDREIAQFLADNYSNWYTAKAIKDRTMIPLEVIEESLENLFEKQVADELPRKTSNLYRVKEQYKDFNFYECD